MFKLPLQSARALIWRDRTFGIDILTVLCNTNIINTHPELTSTLKVDTMDVPVAANVLGTLGAVCT
jgi:hypothetical protein